MRHIVLTFGVAALIAAVLTDLRPVFAAEDTWISGTGADTGSCTNAAPCRQLRYALAQTSPGGTITVLSSGRFGPVNITKSVHIVAEGVEAIIMNGGNCGGFVAAVCINAGADDVVSLQGLTINGDNDFQKEGIWFWSGGALHLDKCTISENTRNGIYFMPSGSASLQVSNSVIAAGGHAVTINHQAGLLRILLDRAQVHDSLHGLVTIGTNSAGSGSIRATIRNSLIAPVGGFGILIDAGDVPVDMMIDRTALVNSAAAIDLSSGSSTRIRIGDSVISGHQIGWGASASRLSGGGEGSIGSYGTNKVPSSDDGGGSVPIIPLK